MKRPLRHLFALCATLLCCSACTNEDITSLIAAASGDATIVRVAIHKDTGSQLTHHTRSTTDELPYPITVFIYDAKGVRCQEVSTNNEVATLRLPYGAYDIYARCGQHSYSNGYSLTSPAMTAHQYLNVKKGDNPSANIVLRYSVAEVSFRIKNIPEEVSDVKISIADMPTLLNEKGGSEGNSDAVLSCTKVEDGVYASPTVYTLPSKGKKTTMKLLLTANSTVEERTITYARPLYANTRYHFSCDYKSSTPTVDPDNPDSPNPDNPNTPDTPDTPNTPDNPNTPDIFGNWDGCESITISTAEMPCTPVAVGKHVLIYCDSEGHGLLFSKEEWEDIKTGTPLSGIAGANGYQEDGMAGWTIPTKEEAQLMKDFCEKDGDGDGMSDVLNLQRAMGMVDGAPVVHYQSESFFLCNNNLSVYSFKSGTRIEDAKSGASYYLRLVKKVRVSVR